MNFLTLQSLPSDLRGAIAFRDLAADQTLFLQGDPAVAFFVVELGRLKLLRYTPEGKSVVLQVIRKGEHVGEEGLFAETFASTAVAEVASRVAVYPKQVLLPALRRHPTLAESLIAMLVNQNQALKVRLELRDIRAAHDRLLEYLRYLARASNVKVVQFDRPLKEIAADLGFTPETLSRALTRLEQEGQITRRKSLITLHNSPAA